MQASPGAPSKLLNRVGLWLRCPAGSWPRGQLSGPARVYRWRREPLFAPDEGWAYADTNYIVVGSHDPSAVIQLESAGAASNSGTNLYAPPYHGTASTATALFQELGNTNVQIIQAYDTATDAFVVYSFGSTNFNIDPGKAYFVKMGTTLAYSPSHY